MRKRSVNPSSAWYVGYTRDDETVESIMKKFHHLEQMQQSNQDLDLEEVFKQTSSFSVNYAMGGMDDYAALDDWIDEASDEFA